MRFWAPVTAASVHRWHSLARCWPLQLRVCGQGGQHLKKMTIAIFRPDRNAKPEVDSVVVRRTSDPSDHQNEGYGECS